METTVETLVRQYLESLSAKGAASRTISNYRTCLNKFCELYGSANSKNLTMNHVMQFEEALRLKESQNSRILALRYLKALRYFVEWCEAQDIIIGLKSASLYLKDRNLQKETYEWQRDYHGAYISKSELAKLNRYWEKDNTTSTLYALRNRAIVAILGDVGIKVSELVRLNRQDFKDPFLHVGDRKLPLEANTRQILRHYFKVRPDSTEPMFVGYMSIEADKIITQPLGVRGIQRLVTKTGEEVGFKQRISPQVLRNSRLIQAIAEHEMDYSLMTYYFGLSSSNTSYQRFIKTAEKLNKQGAL